MKITTLTFFITLIYNLGLAQNKQIDSLKHELTIAKNNSSRIVLMAELCDIYRLSKPDSALKYGTKALALAQKIKFLKGESIALYNLSRASREFGNLPKALELGLKALRIAEENQYLKEEMECLTALGVIYFDLYDYPKVIVFNQKVRSIAQKLSNQSRLIGAELNIGIGYLKNNQLDSSLKYRSQIHEELNGKNTTYSRFMGWLNSRSGNHPMAIYYFKQGIRIALQNNDFRNASFNSNELASLYLKMNKPDSCIFFAKQGFDEGQTGPFNIRILESSGLLAKAYKIRNDYKQAYEYQELMIKTKESLYGAGNMQAIQTMIADDEARRKEVENAKIAYQNQLKQYALLAGLGMVVLIALFLYRNNLREKKAKNLLREQKEKVESTLSQLKSTQAQLIQKEKLASLGELTAGIAHEIQNPLNFVNNFSELSVELIEDCPLPPNGGIDESWIPDTPIGGWGTFLGDLKLNLQKINHHGKRASAIVKGMLEHSRMGTGERTLTDLNKLADEYLRLSYHGFRAKDNSFSIDYELITDENLPKIEVVPQEIGRVLLNLLNNAFYAVNERAKQQEPNYQPKVTVSTSFLPTGSGHRMEGQGGVEIRVKDNGTGIPENIKVKIFQPFFTTKPTGEGTGLGLSLAYDIVTKGHGGTIEVESVEGEGTTFIIQLPTV